MITLDSIWEIQPKEDYSWRIPIVCRLLTPTGVAKGRDKPILDSLVAAGKNLDALTIEDLAPVDQFHGGGMGATKGLVELAEISRSATVLDVGGGLGGPAST